MKHYKLLKDLPTFKKGDTFTLEENGCLYLDEDCNITSSHWCHHVMAYHKNTLDHFPNILNDWFEELDLDEQYRDLEERVRILEKRLATIASLQGINWLD